MKTDIQKIEGLANQRILLTALNWGIGHLTRTLPLISILQKQGNEVVFAGSLWQREYLAFYFPKMSMLDLPDYPFQFKGQSFIRDLMIGSASLLRHTRTEKLMINRMVKEQKIDVLLSDHRYASRSKKCTSVFITHQYKLPLNKWLWPAQLLHRYWMNLFDQIWLMDDAEHRLAGKLGHSNNAKSCFIGHFSRFSLYQMPVQKEIPLLLIISGPQVYAQEFINYLSTRFQYPCPVICQSGLNLPSHFNRVEGGPLKEDQVILRAKKIVSRCGYSTLMDLEVLKCEAELYATKGQYEQEYLAKLHGFNEKFV